MRNPVEESMVRLIGAVQRIEGKTSFSERAHKNCSSNYCFYYGIRGGTDRCSWRKYNNKHLREVKVVEDKYDHKEETTVLSQFGQLLEQRGFSPDEIRHRMREIDPSEAEREIRDSEDL